MAECSITANQFLSHAMLRKSIIGALMELVFFSQAAVAGGLSAMTKEEQVALSDYGDCLVAGVAYIARRLDDGGTPVPELIVGLAREACSKDRKSAENLVTKICGKAFADQVMSATERTRFLLSSSTPRVRGSFAAVAWRLSRLEMT